MLFQNDFSGVELSGFVAHCFFMLLGGVGLILLIVWLVKNLKAKQLLTVAIALLVVGLLGGMLTFSTHFDVMNRVLSPSRGGSATPRSDLNMMRNQMMNNYQGGSVLPKTETSQQTTQTK